MTTPMPQMVTGGSGFIALELIAQLLDKAYTVHTTVRSLQNEKKVAPLRQLQAKHPGKLEIFEADLLKPGSFDDAMKGCSVVYHVASPFLMAEQIKDGQKQCVEPALKGTQNVLDSVNTTESVKRVVFTSTTGAVAGDYADVLRTEDHVMRESQFNDSSTVTHNPYHYSKIIAEREAWRMSEAQKRWDLVVICSGFVFGPSQTAASDSGSLFLLDELMRGWMFYGVPDLGFLTVDVREVALAHIKAAETPSAHGRYIVAPSEMTTFLKVSRIIKSVHRSPIWLPNHQLPTVLVRLVGPLFGLTQKWMSTHLGVRFTVDNSRGIKELGIKYRPVEETFVDHYNSWAAMHGKKK